MVARLCYSHVFHIFRADGFNGESGHFFSIFGPSEIMSQGFWVRNYQNLNNKGLLWMVIGKDR